MEIERYTLAAGETALTGFANREQLFWIMGAFSLFGVLSVLTIVDQGKKLFGG
jgi:hypothetical protein